MSRSVLPYLAAALLGRVSLVKFTGDPLAGPSREPLVLDRWDPEREVTAESLTAACCPLFLVSAASLFPLSRPSELPLSRRRRHSRNIATRCYFITDTFSLCFASHHQDLQHQSSPSLTEMPAKDRRKRGGPLFLFAKNFTQLDQVDARNITTITSISQ